MNKKIQVYGMHCNACELLIENKIAEIPGVKLKHISQKENYVEIYAESEKEIEKVKILLEDLGYKSEKSENFSKSKNILSIIIIFLIIGLFLSFFKDIKFFDNILKSDNYSLLIIIFIGFVASISSCLAITGGIILGFSKYIDNSKGIKSHIKIQSMFHLGRILGYFILGGLLGSLGNFLGGFGFNKFLLFFAGVVMIYMGLNMVNLVPSISKFGISMPKFLANKILNIKNPLFAPIIGALTFFLPCGFTQSMQVLAVSSGNFMHGALIMGSFAIGTFPVLFLVGIGNSYFKDKNLDLVNKIIGVIVIYFGIFILSGFSNMINFNSQKIEDNGKEVYQSTLKKVESKEINIIHDGYGFQEVVLSGAKNYKLIITPNSNGLGCMYGLTVPGLDENEYLVKKGVPIVINLKNPKSGTYKAVCTAMGMFHGKIIIK